MSDLRPVGVKIALMEGREEREHELLFTLNAIDCVQDLFKESIFTTLRRMYSSENDCFDLKIMRTLLTILLNDEAEKLHFYDNSIKKRMYIEKEVGWMITVDNIVDVYGKILQAYRISVPDDGDDDEFEDENDDEFVENCDPNLTTGTPKC